MNPDDVRTLLVLLHLCFPSLLALSSVSFSGLCPSPIFLPFWFRGSKAFHPILFPLIYILKKNFFPKLRKSLLLSLSWTSHILQILWEWVIDTSSPHPVQAPKRREQHGLSRWGGRLISASHNSFINSLFVFFACFCGQDMRMKNSCLAW